jgi:bifunctional non-homologous end joining protein LigD
VKAAEPSRITRRRSRTNLPALLERYREVELATLVSAPPRGDDWVHEIKFDGFRLLGFISEGAVCLRTRNGKDWTNRFPSIMGAMQALVLQSAVFDMEAVVIVDGKTDFQHLQNALGEGGNASDVVAYIFDILHLNGEDLRRLSLIDRKKKLQSVLQSRRKKEVLLYSEHFTGSGARVFQQSCRLGLEGIVSKQAASPYTPGRQRTWLKTKCTLRQEFIILGFSRSRSGPRAIGALYLGYVKRDDLQYAGKVGTGFTMRSALELAERFASIPAAKPTLSRSDMRGLSRREYESISWIKPSILCEVAFTEWTNDGRIRHPSFQGLREDKNARDVKQEVPMQTQSTIHERSKREPRPGVVAGITITHPDRIISKVGNITKGDLAEYYATVAPVLLPHIAGHPLSLLRCPAGIDDDCFFQRNPGKGLGAHVRPFKFTSKGKSFQYLYIEDERGLLELIQMGVIEIHPWGSRIQKIDCPDRMIFDLDPASDVAFESVKAAAQDLRVRLRNKGLESTLKCTGGKGLHVTVPLSEKNEWQEVKHFAASIAQDMVRENPDAYIATMSKARRTGRIFVDYFRNDYTATAIADYSVRARNGMPVAVPLDWRELKTLKSGSQFTMKDVLLRVKTKRGPPTRIQPHSLTSTAA